MLRVEFHCHTVYSKDSLTEPARLVETCRRKSIDRVIITDHNSIAGARIAQEIDPERVIIGEEIMTNKGEILAAFVREEIAPGQSPQAVIAQLRQQSAFVSVSHPFDVLRNGHWELEDLLEILPEVDAIETFNSRCMQAKFNQQAQEFAQTHRLAGTVGSDAHAAFELGRATLLLPEFKDSDSLRAVIRSGQPRVFLSSPFVHLTSRFAVMKKARGKKQVRR
jgi:predicted metal-dependent phosphoesterase TrpH